jgi:uncharacterized RDD family membrane protein YckC
VTDQGPHPLAPLGRRASAWLIDASLGALLALGFVKLAGGEQDVRTLWHAMAFKSVSGPAGHDLSAALNPATAGPSALAPIAGLLAILAVVTAGAVAYRVVTTAKWGAGIGKALLGLRVVVDAATPPDETVGTAPGWGRSWRRWAVPQVPGLIPLPATGLLAYATAVRDPRRRGLHDRAAGTIVIDIRTPSAEPEVRRAVAAPLDFPATFGPDETRAAGPVATSTSGHPGG